MSGRLSQFAVGDRIRHRDSSDVLVVKRIDYRGAPYLTLEGPDGYGGRETVSEVLDTRDLVRADGRPTIYDEATT